MLKLKFMKFLREASHNIVVLYIKYNVINVCNRIKNRGANTNAREVCKISVHLENVCTLLEYALMRLLSSPALRLNNSPYTRMYPKVS